MGHYVYNMYKYHRNDILSAFKLVKVSASHSESHNQPDVGHKTFTKIQTKEFMEILHQLDEHFPSLPTTSNSSTLDCI